MGNTTHASYTSKGDIAVLTDQMGNTTRFGYQDSNGKRLKVSETNAAGNVTRFEYDKNGNETARKYNLVIDGKAIEMVTRKTYDDNGNVLTHTNENGLVHLSIRRLEPTDQSYRSFRASNPIHL